MPLQPGLRPTVLLPAKAAIFDALTAGMKARYGEEQDGVVAPNVSYGLPDEVDQTNELVILGGAQSTDDWAEIGRGARDENIEIGLVVSVWRDGWTQQEVTERALTLLRDCDEFLTGVQILPPPAWTLLLFGRLVEGQHKRGGRVAEVLAGVKVYARI